MTDDRAYNEGCEACKQGRPRKANPYHYAYAKQESVAWLQGWDDALYDAIQDEDDQK